MKQTAVQFVVNELEKLTGLNLKDEPIIEKALEMEKEQMNHCYHDDRPSLSYFESGEAFEEYYNENYETQND
jgi:hypothetical protein